MSTTTLNLLAQLLTRTYILNYILLKIHFQNSTVILHSSYLILQKKLSRLENLFHFLKLVKQIQVECFPFMLGHLQYFIAWNEPQVLFSEKNLQKQVSTYVTYFLHFSIFFIFQFMFCKLSVVQHHPIEIQFALCFCFIFCVNKLNYYRTNNTKNDVKCVERIT